MKKHIKTICNWVLFLSVAIIIYSMVYQNVVDYDGTDVSACRYFDAIDKLAVKSMFAILGVLVVRIIIFLTEE